MADLQMPLPVVSGTPRCQIRCTPFDAPHNCVEVMHLGGRAGTEEVRTEASAVGHSAAQCLGRWWKASVVLSSFLRHHAPIIKLGEVHNLALLVFHPNSLHSFVLVHGM